MTVPADPVAELFLSARAQRERGDLGGAEATLRELLAMAPSHVEGLAELAQCFDAQARGEEAATIRRLADGADAGQLVRTAYALFGTPMEAKAESLLRQALARYPQRAETHVAMVDWLRRCGRWREASNHARQAIDLCPPSPPLQDRLRAFEGDAPPRSGTDVVPTPFRAIENFLQAAERQMLVDLAEKMRADAVQSLVNFGDVDVSARRSRSLGLPDEIIAMFEPKLRATAGTAWQGLGRPALPTGRIGLDFVAHNDGDFYTHHQDVGRGSFFALRRLSFVYYFVATPKRFTGGDLLVFDRGVPNEVFLPERYTRIPVVDNQLLIFPSDVWHEITMVRCPSGRYEDGRFSVVGWLAADPTREE